MSRLTMRTILAKDLRPGDKIVHRMEQLTVKQTDNVDGFIEIVATNGKEFFVKWDKQYVVLGVAE